MASACSRAAFSADDSHLTGVPSTPPVTATLVIESALRILPILPAPNWCDFGWIRRYRHPRSPVHRAQRARELLLRSMFRAAGQPAHAQIGGRSRYP